jgi:hypothetical protein
MADILLFSFLKKSIIRGVAYFSKICYHR